MQSQINELIRTSFYGGKDENRNEVLFDQQGMINK
jgi:hypothetical protein